jgi:hypothetical protein
MNPKIVAFAVCGLMGLCGLSDAGETEKEIEQVIGDWYKWTFALS